jgi:uncharacterized protein (TIGR02145 family)
LGDYFTFKQHQKMRSLSLVIGTLIFLAIQISSALAQETITIGAQVWMSKNLDVDNFRNGDLIPHASSAEEWKSAGENKQPAWCYYDNDPANGAKYGKLYNCYTVNDSRGLAPKGYHLPSGAELLTLNESLGENAGTKLKSTTGWVVNGTNSSGFNGLPGGERGFDGGFKSVGEWGKWWGSAQNFTASLGAGTYLGIAQALSSTSNFDGKGLSVRCLKD